MCSIHLVEATAAILRQNAHHTPAYWWRGDRVMKPICVWGWLGGHDGQRPMGKFGQDAGVTPLLFFEGHPGIFNDHRESGPRFNISSDHYTGALGLTQTTGWAPPAGLTNTSTSSNLVFPGDLPSRYRPGSTLLSFSGQPVLGCRVMWLLLSDFVSLCLVFSCAFLGFRAHIWFSCPSFVN